tara:strand:+ start:850 stop:1140 length:291 start_codon:yes stop_codon:yes gene_type:complete
MIAFNTLLLINIEEFIRYIFFIDNKIFSIILFIIIVVTSYLFIRYRINNNYWLNFVKDRELCTMFPIHLMIIYSTIIVLNIVLLFSGEGFLEFELR